MAQTFTSTDVVSTTNVFADNQSQRTNENTLRSTFSGSTQPSDPVVGQQWYDTANSKTMQYNGTAWVPVDTNGTTQVDVSNAKGSLTSLTSYLRVAHNDDGTLKSSPATAIDEFKDNALPITYLSPTSFTVPSDLTSIFTANRKVKVYLSASTAISYVVSSTFDTVTTVTLGSDVLDATVTTVKYSIIQDGMPQDYNLALEESTGYGIVSGCTPSINGLTVTVASGVVHLPDGTREELSASTITLGAADASNPRIDLVYITPAGVIANLTGTVASLSAPALPTGGISVAQVSVAASATTGTVTDMRNMLPRWYNTGIVNVKDFGAKGDGVTDDTAAIQAAIDYAVKARGDGAGCCIIANGKDVYKITSPIIIKNHRVTLDFHNAIIKVVGAINGIEIYKDINNWGVDGNEVYHLTIKNVIITTNDSNALRAIYAQTCYSQYENVFVSGNSIGFMQAGIELSNCWCVIMKRCWVQFVKGVGLYLQNGCNNLLLERISSTTNGAEGIKLSQGSAIVMNACETSGQKAEADYAVVIYDCYSVNINGIYCEGNDKNIKITGGSSYVSLNNMWITDVANIGVRTETAANIIISGLIREIKENAVGISCSNSTDVDISNVGVTIQHGTFASGLDGVVGYSTYSDKFLARTSGRIGVLSLYANWQYLIIPANGSLKIKFTVNDLLPIAVKFKAIFYSADIPARTVYMERVATMVVYTANQLESFSVNDILVTNSSWAGVLSSAGATISSNVVTWTLNNTSATKIVGCFTSEIIGSKVKDISITVS